MIYLPSPYPDELLMSVVARYCAHIGGDHGASTFRRWFSEPLTVPLALPKDATAFAAHISWAIDGRELLDRHTLRPYYEAFSPERRGLTANLTSAIDGGPARPQRCRIGWNPFMRFCPVCLSDDLRELGETYWRRSHQLPGTLVCADHGVPLRRTGVSSTQSLRRALPDATAETQGATEPDAPPLSAGALARAVEIARRSRAVLHGDLGAWEADPCGASYREAFGRRSASGHEIADSEIRRTFEVFYGSELIDATRVLSTGRDRFYWLMHLPWSENRVASPLRHIMIQLLLDSLPEVHRATPPEVPIEDLFGCGPWYCPNPYGGHSGPSITAVKISHRAKVPTAMADCDCGLEFSFRPRRGGDPCRPSVERVFRMPSTWSRLAKRWEGQGLKRAEIGRRLGIDGPVVSRLIDEHTPTKPSRRSLLLERRRRWKEVLSRTGQQTAAVAADNATYRWLLSHDRDWLVAQRPPTSRVNRGLKGRDWDAYDRELTERLRAAAAIISEDEGSPRHCDSLIFAKAGLSQSLLQKSRRGKIPGTVAFVRGWRETTDDHHARKLTVKAKLLRHDGLPVTEASLRKATNLHGSGEARGPRFDALFKRLVD